ncbi:MAG: UDP-2,3-diacylglucosamine diphosphatase LpxI [Alphaproteobacteria bacterium]|nr:UDP-2,3-diacylglucosamine diphosphatase LpxI [Alphaproteobacteria bacterium]
MSVARPKLGIIAGAGELPHLLARLALGKGTPVHLLLIDGLADPAPHAIPSSVMPLGALGKAFRTLKNTHCREVVFAGQFTRPAETRRLRPDLTALWFLITQRRQLRAGDDAIHRAVEDAFRRRGFEVVSPLAIAPELAAPAGTLTLRLPDHHQSEQFASAMRAAKSHGGTDIGQAIVIRDGEVLAREGRDGTDAMLRRLNLEAKGGMLVKAMKPAQLRVIDPPAIGVHTVEAAAAAGLQGILIEAGTTLIVDRKAVQTAADRLGLFVAAIPSEGE